MIALRLLAVTPLLAAASQAQTSQAITRLRITPTVRSVAVGDSLPLRVEALDARGDVIPGVSIRFTAQGGRFQGSVDSLGVVRAGAPGTMPIAILATSASSRPYSEKIEVKLLAGPAARLTLSPAVTKLVAGQRFHIQANVFTASGDEREGDAVSWTSSNPAVLRVAGGLATAVAPGAAVITASAGAASERRSIQVIPATGLTVNLTPSRLNARQGDVVRFALNVRDGRGQRVSGLTPRWSFSPGNGAIDDDGSFVGNVPGTYVITADLGAQGAEAIVTLTDRDVRRSTDVVGRLPRSAFFTSEVWLHPDGKHAYLGTTSGGDRIYAIDVSNPAAPVITDSIVANSRSMNDMMTTADGKWLVFTREGADDRRNGIVIASTADPAHPRPVSEFTQGVTAQRDGEAPSGSS